MFYLIKKCVWKKKKTIKKADMLSLGVGIESKAPWHQRWFEIPPMWVQARF